MHLEKEVIEQVKAEVIDIFSTDFTFSPTTQVPNVDDPSLTFANGVQKKGKEINTCVLFVDIRNSVVLVGETYTKTMGRIYTAFTKSVLRAAAACGGYVRNIIGDRVMVVFPEDNCFQNAVDCAITINHLSKLVISPQVPDLGFSCGIGIDYGKMRCVKVGVERHGTENADNKNLVWIGAPANIASRLCDVANKEIHSVRYLIEENVPDLSSIGVFDYRLGRERTVLDVEWEKKTKDLSETDFLALMTSVDCKRVLSVNKTETKVRRKPILISKVVYDGFRKSCPGYLSVKNNMWEIDPTPIRDVSSVVYGIDIHWNDR